MWRLVSPQGSQLKYRCEARQELNGRSELWLLVRQNTPQVGYLTERATIMIKSLLSVRMGERRMRVSDVRKATGLPRSTISMLYHDKAVRVDLDALDKLCGLFECEIGDILARVEDRA